MKIYLAGPINGCTDGEASNWRDQLKATDLGFPIAWIDPMRRDFRGIEGDHTNEIVEGDLEDIDMADVMVANCWQPSAGTSMEVFYAHSKVYSTIIVHPKDKGVSPWLRYFSTIVVHDLPGLVKAIKSVAHNLRGTIDLSEKTESGRG